MSKEVDAIAGDRVVETKHRVGRGGDIVLPKPLYDSLYRLSKADRADVQAIAASQIELLSTYHTVVLDQARRSFRWALTATGIGLGFFLAAVGFLLFGELQSVAVVSVMSAVLVEVIAGLNFYLYGKTTVQLADFQTRLDSTQRFLLANSICESLEGDAKHKARRELIRAIARVSADGHVINSEAQHGRETH